MKIKQSVLLFSILLFMAFAFGVHAEGFNYTYPIIISNDNSQDLINYQIPITLQGNDRTAPNFIDFGNISSTGADLNFTELDKTTLIPYWVEKWNSTTKTGTVWLNCSVSLSPTSQFYKFSTFNQMHIDYGLSYPVTYEFNIPAGSANLKAYKKYNLSDSWTQLTEKTSNDFFNGIEAVRFDYPNNKAYISVAFSVNSNDIFLEVVDSRSNQVGILQKIDKYYDNRKAVVVSTAGDWDDVLSYSVNNNVAFSQACDAFTNHKIWFTPGIITNNDFIYPLSASVWSNIQSKIDAGYIEPASHSYSHSYANSANYPGAASELLNSKTDIFNNLVLPTVDRKGNSQYLYAFIEPGGQESIDMPFQLGNNKYLITRSIAHPFYYNTVNSTLDSSIPTATHLAYWDSTNNTYSTVGYSIRIGDSLVDTGNAVNNTTVLNNAFDSAYNQSGIYHLMSHPWAVNWTTGGYADQHLTYISNRTDVWYVGLGDLYLYNFIRDQKISQNLPLTGKTIYIMYNNSSVTNQAYKFDNVFNKNYNSYGLVGLWHMDEGSGTLIADSSGNYFTGTLNDIVFNSTDGGTWNGRSDVSFSTGSSLQFNGVSSYVNLGNPSMFNNLNAFSIELWVTPYNTISKGTIISKTTSSSANGTGFFILRNKDNFEFYMYDGNGNCHFLRSPAIEANNDYFLVCVYTGSQMIMYLNGKEVDRKNIVGFSQAPGQNLVLGKLSYRRASYYNGIEDELHIYNRAISEEEETSHYQRKTYLSAEPSVNLMSLDAIGNPISGAAPLRVQFTSSASIASDAWYWDFENDGKIDSTERNPVYTYENVGIYNVSLTVHNAYGNSTAIKTNYITVNPFTISTLNQLYWWLHDKGLI